MEATTFQNKYIPSVLVQQDLERLEFAKDLRRNPSTYKNYNDQRIEEMTNEIYNKKRAAFQKAHIDLVRYMDMDHNANFYKSRSADVDRLSDKIHANNESVRQAIQRDKDTSRRQFEINEWYNYNKLETLFFLQVFFLASLSVAIIIFLQKNQTITNALAGLLTSLVLIIVVLLGLYRYYYTSRIRDTRLWHRRKFETVAKPSEPPMKCDAQGNLDIDLNALIPKPATECADEVAQRIGTWQSNLQKEMEEYQLTGKTPSRLTGSLGSLVCENLNQV